MASQDGTRTEPAGSPQRSQQAGGGDPAGGQPKRRFSAERKLQAVLRLDRGDPLDLVARDLNVTAARLSEWRERAHAGAAAALKEREHDARDAEITRLNAKIGEITMEKELLYQKINRLETNRPLSGRRLRK